MERYDGKTRKDDIKKYALIAVGVVLIILLYNVVITVVKRVSHPTPDMSIVVASTKILDYAIEDEAEAFFAPLVGDLDGNGKETVEVVALNVWTNSGVSTLQAFNVDPETDAKKLSSYIKQGTYRLFLLSSECNWALYCKSSYCMELPEDIAEADNPYCVRIPGSVIFEEAKMGLIDFYGCIQKDATEEEYEVMTGLLRTLKEME